MNQPISVSGNHIVDVIENVDGHNRRHIYGPVGTLVTLTSGLEPNATQDIEWEVNSGPGGLTPGYSFSDSVQVRLGSTGYAVAHLIPKYSKYLTVGLSSSPGGILLGSHSLGHGGSFAGGVRLAISRDYLSLSAIADPGYELRSLNGTHAVFTRKEEYPVTVDAPLAMTVAIVKIDLERQKQGLSAIVDGIR